MGLATSTNVANVALDVAASVATSVATKSRLTSSSTQVVSIKNSNDIVLSGINQSIDASINLSQMMSAMTTTEAQQTLVQEMQQESKSLLEGLNLLQFSAAQNILNAYMGASLDISTRIENVCSALANTSQAVVLEQVSGLVVENDINQSAITSVISNCMLDAVTSSKAVQDMQQIVDQSAEATAIGIDLWILAVLALIFMLAIILPVVLGGTVIATTIMSLIFPIMLAVGIVFLALFGSDDSNTIQLKKYSTLIATHGECGSAVLREQFDILDPTAAGNVCKEESDCVGFDWIGVNVNNDGTVNVLEPPKTIFYNKLTQNPCEPVLQQQDKHNLIFHPAVNLYADDGTPPAELDDFALPRDAAVSTTVFQYYFWVDGSGWVKQSGQLTEEPLEEKNTLPMETETAAPIPTQGDDDTYLLDTANPSVWKLWLKTDGEWALIREGIPGPGYAVRTGCEEEGLETTPSPESEGKDEVLAEEDVPDSTAPITPPQAVTCGNTSGFKESKPNYVFLGVGIGLTLVGLIGIGLTIFKSVMAKKKNGGKEPSGKKKDKGTPATSPANNSAVPTASPVATPVSGSPAAAAGL